MLILASTFHFSRNEIRALLAHAGDDPERPHTYGFGVFPSSGHAAATDGHRLAALAAKDGVVADEGAPFIVPRDVASIVVKACPKDGVIAIVNGEINIYESAQVELPTEREALATLPFASPDGVTFPPWESLIPPMHHPATVPAFGINPVYLADLVSVHRAAEKRGVSSVLYVPPSTLDPILVVCEEWRVVIMPMRDEKADAASAGVAKAVDDFKKAIPAGTTVTVAIAGKEPVRIT